MEVVVQLVVQKINREKPLDVTLPQLSTLPHGWLELWLMRGRNYVVARATRG